MGRNCSHHSESNDTARLGTRSIRDYRTKHSRRDDNGCPGNRFRKEMLLRLLWQDQRN
ncbi:MAG: hypothetical protein JSU73_12130 [candidate division WOR-3 bacterium]|nr:MAG: hypothetical protein JSU73_12130 [candidate division WOR-3 bacterium]